MTKKDYIIIAKVINDHYHTNMVHYADAEPNLMLTSLTDRLADALNYDNDRFDRNRFLKACGIIE